MRCPAREPTQQMDRRSAHWGRRYNRSLRTTAPLRAHACLMSSPHYWSIATRALAAADPVLARLIETHHALQLGSRGDAFQTLARAIVGQQISVKAAQSVWERFVAAVEVMSPVNVANADCARLRAAGLSVRKAEYVQDLARRFRDGSIEPQSWSGLPDEAIAPVQPAPMLWAAKKPPVKTRSPARIRTSN